MFQEYSLPFIISLDFTLKMDADWTAENCHLIKIKIRTWVVSGWTMTYWDSVDNLLASHQEAQSPGGD